MKQCYKTVQCSKRYITKWYSYITVRNRKGTLLQNGKLFKNGALFENGTLLKTGTLHNSTLSQRYSIIIDWLYVKPNLT
jgi:DUF1680 family protein